MSDFVSTIDNEKISVSFNGKKNAKLNDSNIEYEVSQLSTHTFKVVINNKVFHVTSNKLNNDQYSFLVDGHYFESVIRTQLEEDAALILNNRTNKNSRNIIKSPMPGLILRINKNIGDSIKVGDSLLLLEAMKMENEIRSTTSGIISDIFISEGKSVEKNQELILIK